MTQTRIIREGRYICPACEGIFEVRDPHEEQGDGYCDNCQDQDESYVPLKYIGPLEQEESPKEPPKRK